MKIKLDKYYTNDRLVEKIKNLIEEKIGYQNISEIIECSAGSGAFMDICNKGYDIKPERDDIIQADFLSLELEYQKGRLVGFNPPFGRANKKSVQFFNKAAMIADYVVFIQPISQLNQNRTMWKFDLIYSEDLGVQNYSDKPIHCCLNIYSRPEKAIKARPKIEIDGIYARHIFRMGSQKHDDYLLNKDWDFRIAAWGDIRLLSSEEKADNEVVLTVENHLKDRVRELLEQVDWKKELNHVSSPNLPAHRVLTYLKENL